MNFFSKFSFHNVINGSTSLTRSFRYINLTNRNNNRIVFFDNLASSYHALIQKKSTKRKGDYNMGMETSNSKGVNRKEMTKLIEMICNDFPEELKTVIVENLSGEEGKDSVVSFNQFASGINCCILYGNFFKKIKYWFGKMDLENKGKVPYDVVAQQLLLFVEDEDEEQMPKTEEIMNVLKILKKSTKSEDDIGLKDLTLALFNLSKVETEKSKAN